MRIVEEMTKMGISSSENASGNQRTDEIQDGGGYATLHMLKPHLKLEQEK